MSGFLQALGFGTPLALLGLLALPVLWWLLRFTPPRPRQQPFPPIRILMSLPRPQETPDRTPWWLMLLRLVVATALILMVAQPFLSPRSSVEVPHGQKLIVVDDGWASAATWETRRQALFAALEDAQARGEQVIVAGTAPRATAQTYAPEAARAALDRLRAFALSPLSSDRMALLPKLAGTAATQSASILWLADGLDSGSADSFAQALQRLAPSATLRIIGPEAKGLPLALGPLRIDGGDITVDALRPMAGVAQSVIVNAKSANGRVIATAEAQFGGSTRATARLSLPSALRNQIQSLTLEGQDHAGARQLMDDRWRRKTIALMTPESNEQAQPLLSPLHFVSRGLEPFAELYTPQSSADLGNLLDAGLSMLVLADVGTLNEADVGKVSDWLDRGGILLRFAGPRLAAGHDTLVPVQLREGDRTLGSALSWETPQGLQPFPATSPFAGLEIDPRITVSRQVLAEPDATLADRTWASLADGTPLVTAAPHGKGLIVLFHVTANANWSNLPLSGLFVDMMARVAGLDTTQAAGDTAQGAARFSPRLVLTGDGALTTPDGSAEPVEASAIDKTVVSATHPPGLYVAGGRERALNLALVPEGLMPMAASVAGVTVESFTPAPRQSLVPPIALGGFALFLLDCLATLWLGGRWRRAAVMAASIALLFALAPQFTPHAEAQELAMQDALQPRLAYVKTGSEDVDNESARGLLGLSLVLADRTSASLSEPRGVDVTKDELVFYPLLYWPVLSEAAELDDATRSKVSAYMKNGGMIFFDLRDGGMDSGGSAALQKILAGLDIPPLEPVPDKHVLTRSFYLLSTFPGRYEGGPLWVESSLGGTSADPGTADGVSSIVIGTNDYAAAWAMDDNGDPLFALVPGSDLQREYAFRTGINIVMYALTGNYKADQVHVPALLERLGQ
ncbi:MAG: DUF4159 domain-containing protein [Hyphomicrobiales bacterium]